MIIILLREWESNPRYKLMRLACYRYTIPRCGVKNIAPPSFLKDGAKVVKKRVRGWSIMPTFIFLLAL